MIGKGQPMKHNKYTNPLESQFTAKLQLFLPIYPIRPF